MGRFAIGFMVLAAIVLLLPPAMVLSIEGPSWPAIHFALIQGFLVLVCVWAARGCPLPPRP